MLICISKCHTVNPVQRTLSFAVSSRICSTTKALVETNLNWPVQLLSAVLICEMSLDDISHLCEKILYVLNYMLDNRFTSDDHCNSKNMAKIMALRGVLIGRCNVNGEEWPCPWMAVYAHRQNINLPNKSQPKSARAYYQTHKSVTKVN